MYVQIRGRSQQAIGGHGHGHGPEVDDVRADCSAELERVEMANSRCAEDVAGGHRAGDERCARL